MKFDLTLVGDGKLMCHNGRLANPLDPYTRQLKQLTSKKKKTDEDIVEIARVEARGGLYETDDGLVGLDPESVVAAIKQAAKAYKLGIKVSASLSPDPEVVPLTISGRTWDADEYVSDLDHLDMRPVKISGRKVLRTRPVMRDWTATVRLTLLTDEMNYDEFPKILDRAAQYIGLCEWRPRFGRFTWSIKEVVA